MLNLISDPWIPVITRSGEKLCIAPWQIADADILRPDWPRADLNIACLELLIGLIYMADPPADLPEWRNRQAADSGRLRAKLELYIPAFNLIGPGPAFLQDRDPLSGDANNIDMLFIDSAGGNTAKNNADILVHRGRYARLDPALAAMALYAFQAHAPSGGAGNRTSMRGGGPLVTLIDPGEGASLWDLVWANVPYGVPSDLEDLPWMRATKVSDAKGSESFPPDGRVFSVEAFFGMPRRLRLVSDDQGVTGVIQRPYGTNYALWKHPLSPYYRMKAAEEWLPVHPKPGHFGYRNWLGILARARDSEMSERAQVLRQWHDRGRGREQAATVIVAGWAMSNMKPLDFIYARQPFISEDLSLELVGLIEAASDAALALRGALTSVLAEGEARELERERFYLETEPGLLSCMGRLRAGEDPQQVSESWRMMLRDQVTGQFNGHALPGLQMAESDVIQRIIGAQRGLNATMAGYGKLGETFFDKLGLELPKKGKAA